MTNRELALTLLKRLIDLEVERIAMVNLLKFARVPDTGLPLDWRREVRATREQISQDVEFAKYAALRQSILDATPEDSTVFSLLESVLKGLAPIEDL